jgi:parvulin-like peptidyl-prolyl isomerase
MEPNAQQNSAQKSGNWLVTVNPKYKKWIIAAVIVIVLVILGFGLRSTFVAATVNGKPISRHAVTSALEKQGGKTVLDTLIREKLVESELDTQKIKVADSEIDDQVKKIEAGIVSQGGTLKDALSQQGMDEAMLRKQIKTQLRVEKLFADKVTVTDAEIDEYIKTNKATQPKDMKTEDFRARISDGLKQEKFQGLAGEWVNDLMTKAKVKYYVEY